MPVTPSLSLIVADAGSGVATCSVSGGTPGRTCQFLYSSRPAQVGPVTWTSAGTATFSGAGAASLSPSPGFGYYNWLALQLNAGGTAADDFSSVYFRPLVDEDADSVWNRCVDAVKDVIDNLNLSGITSVKISKKWYPGVFRGMTPQPPCILVAPFGTEEYRPTGVTEEDDVLYPVIVACVDGLNNETAGNMPRDLLWREKISRAIRFQRLAAVPEVYLSEITPEVVVHPDAFQADMLVSCVLFRFISREPRGV